MATSGCGNDDGNYSDDEDMDYGNRRDRGHGCSRRERGGGDGARR